MNNAAFTTYSTVIAYDGMKYFISGLKHKLVRLMQPQHTFTSISDVSQDGFVTLYEQKNVRYIYPCLGCPAA